MFVSPSLIALTNSFFVDTVLIIFLFCRLINNYLDEILNDNSSPQKNENFFINRIARIMYGLGIKRALIDNVVFQNLAPKFLNANQIEELRADYNFAKNK